jgi:hypothetical protein
MPEIKIHFQEGFDDDTAEVSSGNSQVLSIEHLKTSKLLGLAVAKSIDLPEGVVDLEIKLPRRNIEQSVRLDTRKMRHVGVSIDRQGLVVTQSDKAFGYA